MDKKDCKIGYRVRRIDNFEGQKKGIFTIEGFQRDDLVNFEEINGAYSLSNFELFSKFKEGDKVLYYAYRNDCEEVRYCGENSRGEPIVEYPNGSVTRAKMDKLSSIKRKDELEVGDSFIDKGYGEEVKVLATGYDGSEGEIKYFGKRLSDGCVRTYRLWNVNRVIY